MLRILSTCFIRAGSQRYADEHGSYGIASLLKRHVSVRGDLVTFDYRGKSGQQHREVRDRRVATVVRALLKSAPGRSLFQYQLEDGSWVNVRRSHVNASIKEVMGQQFSAKDFRTWAGTLLCACALSVGGVCEEKTKKAVKLRIVAAVKETAKRLGNTPSICKASYVFPRVLTASEQGRVVEAPRVSLEKLIFHRSPGLHAAERGCSSSCTRSTEAAGRDRLRHDFRAPLRRHR